MPSVEPNMGLNLMNCEIMTWAEIWATKMTLDKFLSQKKLG